MHTLKHIKAQTALKYALVLLLLLAFSLSFYHSNAWLQLCYGLAIFLFGMQCIEEGLQRAAGGYLERLLNKSTDTPFKGLLFGMGATFVLQSSTLVSLLTIAFLSAGLIGLGAGIAVLLGTNLGATSGIWLLALAGQNISLSVVALPLLFFGVLASFFGDTGKAFGRALMGIGFIFVGIDAIKLGFTDMGGAVDFTQLHVSGITEILIFTAIGLLLTVVLQSTHAALILTLAALAGGQIVPEQAFALAIGSNVGSSISTAFVGFLGSDRNGQRLALAHVLFNVVTAIISLLLFLPLSALVLNATAWVGLGDNGLIQLALFHTLFNVLGVVVFWRLQNRLAGKLKQWLPDRAEQTLPTLIAEPHEMRPVNKKHGTEAMYLSKASLRASDTAVLAVVNEIRHLSRLTLEVMCHAVYVPAQQLFEPSADTEDLRLQAAQLPLQLDADALYQQHIKGVYSELLGYINRIEVPLSDEQERVLQSCQALALQFAEAVKESKHLQKNLQQYLQSEDEVQQYYARLREYVFGLLLQVAPLSQDGAASLIAQPTQLQQGMQQFELSFGQEVLAGLREGKLSDRQTSSLMNDIAYARRIGHSLLEILAQAQHLLLQTSDSDTQAI
ncbi:MAG: Na/Pi cotransporter family protein [Vitreoscilla sp.]|nr:Na/Pi cotransporter family protein [Vitreoscilla sp.]